jgi:hypothetical protein
MSGYYHVTECTKCCSKIRKTNLYKLQTPSLNYWSNSIIGLFFQIVTNRIYNLFKYRRLVD